MSRIGRATLNRIVSLFRRRGFNIDSLTVGRTERPGISRITVVVRADDDTARRLEANLYKLVNVAPRGRRDPRAVGDAGDGVRQGARGPGPPRASCCSWCRRSGRRVVDLGPESIIVETTGTQEKLDGLIDVLRPFGILELVRTGAVAMLRGPGTGAMDEDAASG